MALLKNNKKILFFTFGFILLILMSGCINETKPAETKFYCPRASEQECLDFCAGLSEEKCFESGECWGIYGPSYCTDGMCTADMVFKKCLPEKISPAEKSKLKEVCEKTLGSWQEDRFGYNCNCPANTIFDKAKGCAE